MEEVSALAPPAEAVQGVHWPRRARARPFRWLGLWSGTAFRAVLIFVFAQTFLVQGYRVYGSCMEPNLFTGERLLGTKLSLVEGVHRGDVIVFRPPQKPETSFIKRVIGLPGDVVEIRNSRVYVNGKELREPYLRRDWHDDRAPERVAKNKLYVLGDNRDFSNDSRVWGEVPLSNVQAKAWFRYWPLSRAGFVP
jgi:signal peptidase I